MNIILYTIRKNKVMKKRLNYMKIINLKVEVICNVNIITTTISRIKTSKSKEDYTAETNLSIQTHMKLLELAEKELDRLLLRNNTSELKRHFNNIEVKLGTVQELKYKIQEQMVSQNEDMRKIDEFS